MIRRLMIISILLPGAFLLFSIINRPAEAISGSEWRAGRIIDDIIFNNKNDMSPDQIQQFLNRMVGTGPNGRIDGQCDTNGVGVSELGGGTRAEYGASRGNPAPFTCLKDYYEVPKTSPGPGIPANNYGGKPVPAGARSAAQLIWDAAQKHNINPKVLLVMIQKESAGPLITDDWPFLSQYTYAMGAYCPDTAPCDTNYAGFSIQVSESAELLRWYLDNMNQPWWQYKKLGNNSILYNPSSSCGSSIVNIETMATAALYTYTPYQPNAAALSVVTNSSPGGSVPCGAYGNRNFWWYFNKWFNSTYANDTYTAHPDGTLIALGPRVYLIENGTKRWITNGDVFTSYGYPWFQLKAATTGDIGLPDGPTIGTLAPGTIFRSNGTPVYIMTYEGSNLVKQQISLSAFNSLGYSWNEVLVVGPGSVPAATASGILFANQHPAGTLISGNGKVYLLDQTSKRWILGPDAFTTNNFSWSSVKTATSSDLSLPDGTPVNLREGNMLLSGGSIYVVDYDGSGILKRPVGPWECFANRWYYAHRDLYQISAAALPVRTGDLATC